MVVRFTKANSLAEYTLPVAILIVVGLALLHITDYGSLFQGGLTTSQRGSMNGTKLEPRNWGKMNIDEISSKDDLKAFYQANGMTYTQGDTLCLAGYNCFSIPNIPEGSIAEVDGTLGGGTTTKLANVLQKIAQQLAADKADAQLQNLVRNLANTGHQMADGQLNLFEYATVNSETYKNSYKYNTDEKERNDPTQTRFCPNDPNCLQQVQNSQNTFNGLSANAQAFSTLHQQLDAYLQKHPEALDGIPGAADIINESADRISQIQAGFKLTYQTDGVSGGIHFNIATNPGHITRYNANTICVSGQGGSGCQRL